MIGALWTGISGLASHQTALDNEANNIANVNTVGYKASRISFADQMYQSEIGKGTIVQQAEKIFDQGNLKITGVSYDMALSGDGFFTVTNEKIGGVSETFFTRAGNFRVSDSGQLTDAAGNKVQGWAMAKSDFTGGLSGGRSADNTDEVFTSDYSRLGDSKIIKHSDKVETRSLRLQDYTSEPAGKVTDIEGKLSAYRVALEAYQADPTNDTKQTTLGTTRDAVMTSVADTSVAGSTVLKAMEIVTTVSNESVDTKSALQVQLDKLGVSESGFGEFSVQDDGLVIMRQDGVDYAIGQVAVARFSNNRGLEAMGGNLYRSNTSSGEAQYNTNNDLMAEVKGATLELSKADLSESLVNMMVYQRAFEANAKSVTTSDELLNTLINIKR